jgi:periplasmic divalent cation tolerance protein
MAVDNRNVVIVMTNLPDSAAATRLAALLVENHHAACVNILAECQSIYRWEGKIETATEVPLLIKTTRSAYPRVEEVIRANHPYQLPEIVSLPADNGLPAYLDWVAAETTNA